ncbi:hypothetical protein FE257_009998 [Aspergillus nanangensis]|uniref:Amino acid permease/ SLC12A domain-containing protein n=1 Tax=Aspergillus nanangensis TaxID=2582783 RepID=A0AAD4CWM6_ASPNN|nr:hypothetical protein FE257_009998 [Aspergillus nanangensis]
MVVGPTVGTGLFIGSGQALAAGGPASLISSYIFISILVYCLTTAVAEIAAHMPAEDGTMLTHTHRYTSSHLGFSVGYLRWYSMALLVPFEITNAMVNLGLWIPEPKVAIRLTIVICVIFGFNMLPERTFKRSEVAFTGLKLITATGLAIVSVYLAIRGVPGTPERGFHYWRDPGPMKEYLVDGPLGQFLGLVQCVLYSTVSFIFSPEMIVQKREQLDSEANHSILRLSQLDNVYLFIVYILSALAISIVAPSDDPLLTNHGIGAGMSPYLVGIKKAHIPVLPTVTTTLIFLSSIASARSFLYISSRTLCSLAEIEHAPSMFKARNKYGVPYVSVIATALFSGFAYLSLAVSSSAVFNLLMYFITTSGCISWLCSCIVYLRFRRTIKARGHTSVHRARIQPYGAYFGIFFSALLPLASAAMIVAPTHNIAQNFISVFVGIVMFPMLYFGHQARAAIGRRYPRDRELSVEDGCDLSEKPGRVNDEEQEQA